MVENYPSSPSVEEALVIMIETYQFLDLKKAARDSIALLRTNFPDSDALNEDGEFVADLLKEENRSLTNVVTFGLMGDE